MAIKAEKGPGGPVGSDLNVLHTERDMTVYVLTDSDLERLGDLNGIAAAFTSLAAFFGALWLDLYKDEALAEKVPLATQEALDFVQPLLAVLTISFAIIAGIFWYKRGTHKKRIKNDSRSKSTVRGEVRPTSESDGRP